MGLVDFIEKYGATLLKGLYPVAGGLIIAMLLSSAIYYRQYHPELKRQDFRPSTRVESFNVNRAVTEILNKNVLGLKVTEEKPTKGGKGKAPATLKDVTLLGVFLGRQKVAVLKSGDELLYLKPGDEISGYRVSELRFDSVLLKGKRGGFVLTFPEEKHKRRKTLSPQPMTGRTEAPLTTDKIVVKRQEVLEKAKDLNKLLTTTRIAPYYNKGEFIGYRLAMLKRNTFLYKIGLRAGDIIKRINGEDVSSPERLVEMLSKLDTLTAVNIDMLRRGKRKTLFIEIED